MDDENANESNNIDNDKTSDDRSANVSSEELKKSNNADQNVLKRKREDNDCIPGPSGSNMTTATTDKDDEEEKIYFKDYMDYYNCDVNERFNVVEQLGNFKEDECTYFQGYIRQPVYSCKTCEMNLNEDKKKMFAGVCLGCAENCHKGHNLLELYSKRDFQCDCGNDKFKALKCTLINKVGFNEENSYNQNYSGLYCTCHRPYPDEEFLDNMYCCSICEDWFHQSHLDHSPEDAHEFACPNCANKYKFLQYYLVNGFFKMEDDSETKFFELMENYVFKQDQDCKLKKFMDKETLQFNDKIKIKSFPLPLCWRLNICKCTSCMSMYKDLGIEFITNPNDMQFLYNHENRRAYEKKLLKPFENRMKNYLFIEGFNKLRTLIRRYFGKWQDKGLVKEVDVDEFIKDLPSLKRIKN